MPLPGTRARQLVEELRLVTQWRECGAVEVPAGVAASDGQLTGSLPPGLTLPKIASATACPASVLPW